MTAATPYSVPPEPGRWRAIGLAVMVHAALLAFLWIGVRWQNETPVAVEAEVWDLQTRAAAPRPIAVPEPEPEQKPVVKAEPKPVAIAAPKPVIEESPDKPDIALEQEKKRKLAQRRKADKEQKADALMRKKEAEAEDKAQALAQKKREAEDAAKKALKIANEKMQKMASEKAEKKKLDDKKLAQEASEQKLRDKVRDDEMRRIAGITGSGGNGDAPKSTGNNRADASYSQKVGARIKSNTVFNTPDDLAGNPAVEYKIELLPDGSLRGSPHKLKSSGVPGFDEAVRRAIEKSAPFPPDKSGTVPSSFIVSHKPKD